VPRGPLLLTMSFGRHLDPGAMAGFVRRHREVHADRLARYEQSAAAMDAGTPDVFARSTLQFGIEYERAVLAWFDGMPDEIRGDGPARVEPA
jgi:hypothetical protein